MHAHSPFTQGSPAPHALPHAPQLSGSLSVCTHASPQRVVPAGQAHLPVTQISVGVHAAPHAPQLSGSTLVSTHALPHAVNGGVVHVAAHAPDWQNGVAPLQTTPQAPQLFGSLPIPAHTPLHACSLGGHAHAPATHACPLGHALPQPPQFAASDCAPTHDVPHLVRPGAQAAWHVPFEHTRPASHAWPHDPQLAASASASTHAPLQLVWPFGHVAAGGTPHTPERHV